MQVSVFHSLLQSYNVWTKSTLLNKIYNEFVLFLLCYDIDLNWLLSELNIPHILFRIPRRSYVGHDNLRFKCFFPITNPIDIYLCKSSRESRSKIGKNSHKFLMLRFFSIHNVLKRNHTSVHQSFIDHLFAMPMVVVFVDEICLTFRARAEGTFWHGEDAGVAKRLCIGLPYDDPGFDYRWVRCNNRASRPSQGTMNGNAVSKWPRCRWDVKHNQLTDSAWGPFWKLLFIAR